MEECNIPELMRAGFRVVSYKESQGRDFTAFSFDLHYKGQKVANAYDNGDGSAPRLFWRDGRHADAAYKALAAVTDPEATDDIVYGLSEIPPLQKKLKNKTIFFTLEHGWQAFNTPYGLPVARRIAVDYPGAFILNLMPK